MIEQLLQEWNKKAVYNIPEVQLFQMLSYLQLWPEKTSVVLADYPQFLQHTCTYLKKYDLKSLMWNTQFVRDNKETLRKASFYEYLSPELTGEYSLHYVESNPPEVSQISTFVGLLASKRPDEIELSYLSKTGIPYEMLDYWYQTYPEHCLKFLNRTLLRMEPCSSMTNAVIHMADVFYALYTKTKHPAFMLCTQIGCLNGCDVDDKKKAKEKLKSLNIQPWNKNTYHQFIEEHSNTLVDCMFAVMIKTRPQSQKGDQRKYELWEIVRKTLDIPHLLKMSQHCFNVRPDADYFKDSALEEKHNQFMGLVQLELLSLSQYMDYLHDTIHVDAHPQEASILI